MLTIIRNCAERLTAHKEAKQKALKEKKIISEWLDMIERKQISQKGYVYDPVKIKELI